MEEDWTETERWIDRADPVRYRRSKDLQVIDDDESLSWVAEDSEHFDEDVNYECAEHDEFRDSDTWAPFVTIGSTPALRLFIPQRLTCMISMHALVVAG